ncbi:DedA family protein [Mesobacillus subterraneus]|uniref:DedA family protein n=1 Tax=Mesobacillus subterraneus TaxID=285983 RepID=A0A3R9FGN9_9BACI|nr:DedA family protein [Mesobacillus subterraneus]RSD27571.1 DedA family protein [Mesobacillus subterraneus]
MQDFILNVLDLLSNLGYLGIALGLMLEVIPSEIVLGYGGYMVSKGSIGFIGAVIAGTIGGTLAQLFLYWLGYYGGRPVLEKYGKYLLINKHHLDVSEQWFNKYGPGVIFSARFIPVVRHAISIPAGIVGMSSVKFTLYTIAAIIPWTVFFLYLGIVLGENWAGIKEIAKPYIIPVSIIALGAGAVYLVAARKQK